jgi:hypothetical protein
MHKGDYLIPKNGFVDHIELKVCDEVERLSVVDTKERIVAIREWIKQNRFKNGKVKRLVWTDPEKYDLDRLSEKLFYSGYTEEHKEFKKIFVENKKIKWLRSVEELAYLFYFLRSKDIISPINTIGYLKHVEYIFDHLDIKNTYTYDLNGLLIRIKNKHQEMKMEIETMIIECLFDPDGQERSIKKGEPFHPPL